MGEPTITLSVPNQLFIDGRWVDASDGRRLAVINPADESTLCEVAYGGRADADRAVAAAARAWPAWRATPAPRRAAVLRRVAERIRSQADTLAQTLTLEQGKPLAEARAEVLHAADEFEWFAEEARRAYGRIVPASAEHRRHFVIKQPVGVVGTITPWNFPIALIARKVAPALAAGCTVVSRPADQTPLSALGLFQCLEAADLPPGVANLVVGEPVAVADAFFAHAEVRKISFTGSTAVGKELIRRSADGVKRLSLELGGHAPLIVCPDVEIESVARAAVAGKFRNAGQVCIAPSRFFIHQDRAAAFTEAVVEQVRALRVGPGWEPDVQVGPLIDAHALDKAHRLVDDARQRGGRLLEGGCRDPHHPRGFFYRPTVLTDLDPNSLLIRDEPFVPVLPLASFHSLDEVIAKANDTPYGLAAYVFTHDLTWATCLAEGIEAGIIGVNDPVPTTVQCPFGGMKQSGIGRELGLEGLDAYLETKYVSLGLRSP
ncbi:MAG: NAD-dependent succinate-semialdehyde dehydrogenase [Isosphaeraceae bacterium]|jgi:succinate-semialdehyde dehydrogenase/glutarate-semialdehyde dehydrogenase|nr:MAG: NAD-dependent succinate-semialdehyde dehydrogenase [Isosphaeraceae bacterium]